MTPLAMMAAMRGDGLKLTLDGASAIRVRGPREAVARWAPTVRDNKAKLLDALATWADLVAAIHTCCAVRGDTPEHRAALLDDCAGEAPTDWAWWTDYFRGEARSFGSRMQASGIAPVSVSDAYVLADAARTGTAQRCDGVQYWTRDKLHARQREQTCEPLPY